MRVVIQRVSRAQVTINSTNGEQIDKGLLILVGIEVNDTNNDAEWMARKVCNLRIFPDTDGVMNLSLKEVKGEILLISQFTLHASTKKGNRPSYIRAAKPDIAIPIYTELIRLLEVELKTAIKTGEFGADMQVELKNEGPVTIIIDTKNKE